MRKFALFILAVIVAVLIAIFGINSGSASAHTPNIKSTCSGLELDFTNYQSSGDSFSNVAEVWIDGQYAGAYPFDNHLNQVIPWDKTNQHVYIVTVDAYGTNNPEYEGPFNGTFTGICVVDTTVPTTTPPETTMPPTTTTVTETTTTVPEVTTTIPEVTTTTSTVPDITTTVPETTTTLVVGISGTSPSTVDGVLSQNTQLPVTGSNSFTWVILAGLVFFIGVGAWAFSRRNY